MKNKQRRSHKFIQPALQWNLMKQLVLLSAIGLILQFGLFVLTLTQLSDRLPRDSATLLDESYSALMRVFLFSLFVLLPIMVLVGVRVTHRIAGPMRRFTGFLEAVERGEGPSDCTIRKADLLHDFCALLNRVTEPMRRGEAGDHESSEERDAA